MKKNVDTFLIDQLGRKSFPLLADDTNENEEDGEKQIGFKAPPVETDLNTWLATEEINEFWVLGETCSEPFIFLNVQERQLLKWRYIDDLRSSEISKKISEHPNTVREHLAKTRAKIQNYVIESDLKDIIDFR